MGAQPFIVSCKTMPPHRRVVMIVSTYTLLVMLLAGVGPQLSSPRNSLMGQWGGDHVTLSITAEGGHLGLDCGAGNFPAPLSLGMHGKFNVAGTLQLYQLGPTRPEDDSTAASALFTGHLDGNSLTLDIRTSSSKIRYHYNLVRNKRTKLVRCL